MTARSPVPSACSSALRAHAAAGVPERASGYRSHVSSMSHSDRIRRAAPPLTRYVDHLSRRDCRSSRRACSSAISAVRTAIGDSPAPGGRSRPPPPPAGPGPAGARQQGRDADRAVEARGEVPEGERRPAGRARAADRGQVTPADQAAARVGEGGAWAAARALGVQDRADPLPAVAQAALVADVLAGRRHLEEQRRAVLGRAGQGPRVGEVVQAVEPAAAPAARRGVAAVPHAARVADGPVDAGGAEREAGEAGLAPSADSTACASL